MRVLLVHWKSEELPERAEKLRRAGFQVTTLNDGKDLIPRLKESNPHVVVIDLNRLPSHGKYTASFIRERKTWRHLPIVFVDGAPEKVAEVRKRLPDTEFATWRGIRGAIKRAVKNAPKDPVVPRGVMDYSGTPLPKKLGVKPGMNLALLDAPSDFEKLLGNAAREVTIRRSARGRADLIMIFANSLAALDKRLRNAQRIMRDGGSIWIAWPKKSSGVQCDLTQQDVRELGLSRGLVDYKICSIDETWSGLRFARRK
jgi:CheY-like chemotaxis protein